MKSKYIRLLQFCVIFVAFACVRSTSTSSTPQSTEPITFDVEVSDSLFLEIDLSDKWSYLEELALLQYTNPDTVDQWLSEQLSQLYLISGLPNEGQLFSFYYTLYSSDLKQAAGLLARNILSDPVIPDSSLSHGIASAVILKELTILQETDSFDKYLTILAGCIASDSSRFLRRAYYDFSGSLAMFNGDFFNAVVNYNKAFQYTDSTDTSNLFILHNNLANMYVNMNFFEKAEYHADQAITLIGIEKIPYSYFNTLSSIRSNAGQFQEAEDLLLRAIKFSKDNNYPGLLAQSYGNYGNLKRKQGRYTEALDLMARSDSICRQMDIGIGLLINQINRAEVYLDEGKYAVAEQEIEEAFPALQKFDMPYLSLEYFKLRHRIYDAQGKEALAYRDLQAFLRFKEEYLGDLPRSIISEWERTSEREYLTKKASLLALSLDREVKNKYLTGFVLATLLFLGSVFYLIISRKRFLEKEKADRERQQLKFDLEMKSRELLADSLNNLHIQQIKEQMLETLEEILADIPATDRQRFSKLTTQLKTNSDKSFLVEFEKRFTGVHEEFTKKLQQLAPDLTPNELRVSAFIRLNITSKDIARLTNRNLGTIENTRISIRKKLRLDSEANLQQFLLGI